MDRLAEIMAHKRREVAPRVRPVRPQETAALARRRPPGRGFAEALRRPDGLAVIAEVKRKSPSAGDLRPEVNAAEQARRYYNAGADALSILTDEHYFGGTLRDLWEVHDLLGRRADAPPLLRKDFTVHPVQIVEAAEAGARAVLLIVRALTDAELREFAAVAADCGLDSLFEVHDEPELERALAAGAAVVGVNNRDLARMRTDLAASERLLPLIPPQLVRVSESGIAAPEDAARVRAAGADAILVGEALMRQDDPEPLLRALRAAAP